MIKIIIVDSDKTATNKIKKVISRASINFDLDVQIEQFSKYDENLNNEIKMQEYKKIYILEVELGSQISGIMVAEKIREEDWDSEIIFVTNHDKMFETVYRTVPDVFDFIEKFHNFENKLKIDLERIFKKNFDYKMLKYKSRNVNIRIYYNSILYIYRDTTTRKLVIVTKYNSYYVSLSILEMMNYLDERFIIVHRACIVNSEAISKLSWNQNSFTLSTGETVNLLSKKYKKELEEILN